MFGERVMLPDGRRVEIRLERGGYRVACARGDRLLVEYAGDGKQYVRRVPGREERCDFRSVEQLRYDFERDVADAAAAG